MTLEQSLIVLGIQSSIFLAAAAAFIAGLRSLNNKREEGEHELQKQLNYFRDNYARASDIRRMDEHLTELRREMNKGFEQLTNLINKQ